jgi:hypothetical protein
MRFTLKIIHALMSTLNLLLLPLLLLLDHGSV